MRRGLIAALGVLTASAALGACAQDDYGYEYRYDPYLGPRGYYRDPFHPGPRPNPALAGQPTYSGPHEAGYRGPYVSGPYYGLPEGP